MKQNKPLEKKQCRAFGFVKYKAVPCTGDTICGRGSPKNQYAIEVYGETGELHCVPAHGGLPEYFATRKLAEARIEELIQHHKSDVESDGIGEPVPRYYKDNQFLTEIKNIGCY